MGMATATVTAAIAATATVTDLDSEEEAQSSVRSLAPCPPGRGLLFVPLAWGVAPSRVETVSAG